MTGELSLIRLNYKSISTKYVLSYLLVVLIPLLVSIVISNFWLKEASDRAVEQSEFLIKKAVMEIDERVSYLNSVILVLQDNASLNRLIRNQPESANSDLELLRTLKMVCSRDKSIEDVMVYCPKTDKYILSSGIGSLSSRFNILFPGSGYTVDEFKDKYFAHSQSIAMYSEEKIGIYSPSNKQMVIFVYALPMNVIQDPDAFVVFFISADELFRSLEIFSAYGEYNVEIADQYGKEIFLSESSELNKKTVELGTKSDFNNWKYMVRLNYNNIVHESMLMRNLTIIFFLLLGAFLFCLIFRLARRNAKPIRELVNTFAAPDITEKNKNEIERLKNILENAIKNENKYQEFIKENFKILKRNFLEQLLICSEFEENEIAKNMQSYSIDLDGKRFLAVLFTFSEKDRETWSKVLFYFEEFFMESALNVEYIDRGITSVVAIFSFLSTDESENLLELENSINLFKDFLASIYTDYIKVSIGCFVDRLKNINISYECAQKAKTDGSVTQNGNLFWIYEHSMYERYYYPLQRENELITSVRANNIKKIDSIFKELIEENYDKRVLSDSQMIAFGNEIKATLEKICKDIGMDRERRGNFEKELSQIYFDFFVRSELNKVYNIVLDLAKYNFENKDSILIWKMMSYIHDNYSDLQLSRRMLADYLGYSEEYTSKLFKQACGVTFHSYLETYRINKAKELLSRDEFIIEDIGLMVGYSNDFSFRRAFKRITGVSPKQFRQNAHLVDNTGIS